MKCVSLCFTWDGNCVWLDLRDKVASTGDTNRGGMWRMMIRTSGVSEELCHRVTSVICSVRKKGKAQILFHAPLTLLRTHPESHMCVYINIYIYILIYSYIHYIYIYLFIWDSGCLLSTLKLLRVCAHQTLSGFWSMSTHGVVCRGEVCSAIETAAWWRGISRW